MNQKLYALLKIIIYENFNFKRHKKMLICTKNILTSKSYFQDNKHKPFSITEFIFKFVLYCLKFKNYKYLPYDTILKA